MAELIRFVGTFFYIAIFARVILSWFPASTTNPIVVFIYAVTEPLLSPIRRIVPRFGMIDLSPMIALLSIVLIQELLSAVFG